MDERAPVANHYFGGFRDGSFEVRGIEARRRDALPSPPRCSCGC
jgi:hypothetical protein